MVAVSANGAIGHAGLLLILAASTLGALTTGFAIVTGDHRGMRQSLAYAWLILAGAVVAVFAMQRALEVRDYSIAFVQQVGSSSTPGIYNVAAMVSCGRNDHPCYRQLLMLLFMIYLITLYLL